MTVFVTTDGDVAQAAWRTLHGWVGDGLCSPFLVVNASGVDIANIAEQEADLYEADGSRRVQLAEHVARNFSSVLRLVAVHFLVDKPDGSTSVTVDATNAIDAMLTDGRGRYRLATTNLFVPAFGIKNVPYRAIQPTWRENLVVAPEDRVGSYAQATPVVGRRRAGEINPGFVTHGALACAIYGGIWRSSPCDATRDDGAGSGVQDFVEVVRSFVRILDGEDPTEALAIEVLQPTKSDEGPRWPIISHDDVIELSNPVAQLRSVYQDSLELSARALWFKSPPLAAVAQPTKIRILDAFALLFKFLGSRLRRLPGDLIRDVTIHGAKKVERLATALTVGEGSEFVVRLGGRSTPEDDLTLTLDASDVVDSALLVARLVQGAEGYLAPDFEELWTDFRRISLGLVDGSPMPDGITPLMLANKRGIVLAPELIVSSPHTASFVVPEGDLEGEISAEIVVTPFDPYGARALERYLNALSKQEFAAPPDATALGAANLEVRGAAEQAQSSSKSTIGDEVSVSDLGVSDDELSRRRELARLAVQRADDLRSWRAQNGDNLVWQVGWHLAEQIDIAREQLGRSLATVTAGPPSYDGVDILRKAQKRQWRRLVGSFFVAVVAVVLAISLAALALLAPLVAGLIVVIVIVAWVLVGAFGVLRLYREEFRLKHRFEEAASEYERAVDAIPHATRELTRLGSLHWQYKMWAEIIAYVLHEPWGSVERSPVPGPELAVDNAPLSCRSASAEIDIRKLEPIFAQLRADVFSLGWLQRVYRTISDAAMTELQRQRALLAKPQPTKDRMQGSTGALASLVGLCRSGQHGVVATEECQTDFGEHFQHLRPTDMYGRVLIDGLTEYPDAAAGVDRDPIDGLFEELLPDSADPEPLGRFANTFWADAGVSGASNVGRVRVSLPDCVNVPAVEGMAVEYVPVLARDRRLIYSAIRVDYASICAPDDLVLFDAMTRNQGPGSEPVGGDDGD